MIRLAVERPKRFRSKSAAARAAEIGEGRFGRIENGRDTPYPRELARIALALDWEGHPEALLESVDDDARDS